MAVVELVSVMVVVGAVVVVCAVVVGAATVWSCDPLSRPDFTSSAAIVTASRNAAGAP